MRELLEFTVRRGEDPELPVQSWACFNVEYEDRLPRYQNLQEVLQDGWAVVSVLPSISPDGIRSFQTFWLQRERPEVETAGW